MERYAVRGEEAFLHDELIQVWILHHMQIIGEALYKLPRDFRTRYPEIPWNGLLSMRNILVHEYFTRNHQTLWNAVVNVLPDLKVRINAIQKDIIANDS